jgi:hypothetical protein
MLISEPRRYRSPGEPGAEPPTPPPTPPAEPPASPPPTPPAEPDFYVKPDGSYAENFWEHPAFPAELKDNMQIRTHKGLADTLNNFHSLHKSQGFDKIQIPGKDAKPEVWDANVWQRLGTPKEAKGYTVPDFAQTGLDPKYQASEAERQQFLDAAHKARLTDWQFGQLTGEMNRILKDQIAASEQQAAQAREEALKPIRQRLGGRYDETRASLETFVRTVADPAHHDSLLADLDDPRYFSLFEKIAPAFREAQADLAAAATPANVLADYESQVARLIASEAYRSEFHPEHKDTVAKVNEMRKVLFAARGRK